MNPRPKLPIPPPPTPSLSSSSSPVERIKKRKEGKEGALLSPSLFLSLSRKYEEDAGEEGKEGERGKEEGMGEEFVPSISIWRGRQL